MKSLWLTISLFAFSYEYGVLKYTEIDLNLLPEANKQKWGKVQKEISQKKSLESSKFLFVSLSALSLSVRLKQQQRLRNQKIALTHSFSLILLPGKQTKGVKFNRFTLFCAKNISQPTKFLSPYPFSITSCLPEAKQTKEETTALLAKFT